MVAISCTSLAGTPSTQPTSAPSTLSKLQQRAADAQEAVVVAERNVVTAHDSAVRSIHESKEYRDAEREYTETYKALLDARQNGTPEAKVIASSYFNKARKIFSEIEPAQLAANKELADAKQSAIHAQEICKVAVRDLSDEQDRLEQIRRRTAATKAEADAEAAMPFITIGKLEATGDKYDGQRVKMKDCRFGGISAAFFIKNFPGLDSSTDDEEEEARALKREHWLCFVIVQGSESCRMYALKRDFADFLSDIKRGTPLEIQGVVLKLKSDYGYAVVCEKIEKIKVAIPATKQN
jgi:hypothetical protein